MLLTGLSTLLAKHNLDDSKVPDILAYIMVKEYPNLAKIKYGFPRWENDTSRCSRCSGNIS